MKQVLMNSMLTMMALCIFIITSVDIAEQKFPSDEVIEFKPKDVSHIPDDADIISPLFISKF